MRLAILFTLKAFQTMAVWGGKCGQIMNNQLYWVRQRFCIFPLQQETHSQWQNNSPTICSLTEVSVFLPLLSLEEAELPKAWAALAGVELLGMAVSPPGLTCGSEMFWI